MFRVRVFTSSGSTGRSGRGGDAKTIISPNTFKGRKSSKILRSTERLHTCMTSYCVFINFLLCVYKL